MRLIDADYLVHILNVSSRGDSKTELRNNIISLLLATPVIDAKPVVRAYWIGGEFGHCSNCAHSGCTSDIWNDCEHMYCPNCGASLRWIRQ